MEHVTEVQEPQPRQRRFNGLQVLGIVLVAIILTLGMTFWAVKYYLLPQEFTPVTLNPKEEQRLNAKLERLELGATGRDSPATSKREQHGTEPEEPLEPEAYSEVGAKREISLSEKELNAMLAKNTDLARKLAIDLSDDLISAKLLVPVDEDFPVLGGQTLKVRAGVELSYISEKPVVVLKGVSVMGVPIPSAWLGGLKNIDLIEEFGGEAGFWQSLAGGIDDVRIQEGSLYLKLKE